jgi:hypothetical protein
MDEGIHVAGFLGRDVILDIEAFDFAGKAGAESCCVKLGDVGDAGFASMAAAQASAMLLPTGIRRPGR